MIDRIFNLQKQETEEHWVSISDVMAGLMVIFLFISISYMVNANNKTERIREMRNNIEQLLNAYTNLQADLSEELKVEFEGTPIKRRQFQVKWQGHLDMSTLSIRFKKPFIQGNASVPIGFKRVLYDFFPRYISILSKPEYRNEISEIRIEGHTSSEWHYNVTSDEAYYNNMELSQNRARNVLGYVLEINNSKVIENKQWIKQYLTANGLSSSRPILTSVGGREVENLEESRRVEFRVVTKSEKLINEIQQLLEAF